MVRRHGGKERGRRLELEIVGRVKDVERGAAVDTEDRVGTLGQPRAEDGMRELRRSLGDAFHRVVLRRHARTEAFELRKDVPHPMRPLGAATDFSQRRVIVARLGVEETLKVERIAHRSQARIASLSIVSISARLARHPEGLGELASMLYLSAVSKQRLMPVMITTCGADRGSAALKYP